MAAAQGLIRISVDEYHGLIADCVVVGLFIIDIIFVNWGVEETGNGLTSLGSTSKTVFKCKIC